MSTFYERIYAFIAQYNQDTNQMPTLREIEAGVDMSQATISIYLDKMQLMGMLERPTGKVRAIALIRREANWNALLEE